MPEVDKGLNQTQEIEMKTLHNTDANDARKNVSDLMIWGDGDAFILLSKASSEKEGWMKSTKAMEIPGAGCIVQVTTQQRNPDGSYAIAEALTFVPGIVIDAAFNAERKVTARWLTEAKLGD